MISEIEGVSSRSVGEEPYRKIIISSLVKKERRHGDKRGGKGGGRRGGGRNRNFEPKSLDLKTSFEKDYKKPKPEDDLKAGLYGKIEI
jgi:spoIIIJ-associated protein